MKRLPFLKSKLQGHWCKGNDRNPPTVPAQEPNSASTALSCGSMGIEGDRKEVWFKLPSDWHIEPKSESPGSTQRWTFPGQ